MGKKAISGIMLTLLFMSLLGLALNVQPVKASWDTIYIRADGSVEPSGVPILRSGDLYTLTGNITSTAISGIVIERDNMTLDGAGYTFTGPGPWVQVTHSYDVPTTGMSLNGRTNVTVTNFQIRSFYTGIYLDYSSNSSISANNMRGIWLEFSSGHISSRDIRMMETGIVLSHECHYNRIAENNLTELSTWGIGIVVSSSYNNVSGNNVEHSHVGISLESSASNNYIYHNNFVDNEAIRIYSSGVNFWDKGYPSGGNYWSDYWTDYPTKDKFSGPYQNETGPDGIGDTPYTIWDHIVSDCFTIDRYPLMFPRIAYPIPPVAKFLTWSPSTPMCAGEPVTFNASSSVPGWNQTHVNLITMYSWDFGDSNITSTLDPIITHVFALEGTYNATLTVLDAEGLNFTTWNMIEVMMPTMISISTDSPSTFVGYAVDINGTLHDIYGNGLENQIVVLYYTFPGADTPIPITSDTTDQLGKYYIKWIPPATGYFTLKAEWTGNTTHLGASNNISLSTVPYQNEYVFSVESNSTISALAFNATSGELSFETSGPSGTRGHVKVTIAKILVVNKTDIKVYLDGEGLDYTSTSLDDSWQLQFTYEHSTHNVIISIGAKSAPSIPGLPFGSALIYGVVIAAMSFLALLIIIRKKHIRIVPKAVHDTSPKPPSIYK